MCALILCVSSNPVHSVPYTCEVTTAPFGRWSHAWAHLLCAVTTAPFGRWPSVDCLACTITSFWLCRPPFARPAQEMARPAQEISAFHAPFMQDGKKYEIAQVDKDWDLAETPSARFWYPFTKAGGEKAMRDEEELLSSCFSRGRAGSMKYRWHRSVFSTDNGPMKVYAHCSNFSHPNTSTNCYVMVRFAPTLRVLVLPQTEQEHNTYGPHARIELRMRNIHSPRHNTILWNMTFPHQVEDITMRMVINAAKKDLVEQEHVTSAGKVEFYFHGQDVTKKPATVLVKKTRSKRQSACIALFLFV